MKINIGMIADENFILTQLQAIKDDFPGIHIQYAEEVMELTRLGDSKRMQAIVFAPNEKNEQEFANYHYYLQQKPNFKELPIAILSNTHFRNKLPISDPRVKSYCIENGFFFPALFDFFSWVNESNKESEKYDDRKLTENFNKSITNHLARTIPSLMFPANDDDVHLPFVAELHREIACNLLWLKYSIRLLDKGSEELVQTLDGLNDAEVKKTFEQILEIGLNDFTLKVNTELMKMGAAFFCPTNELPLPYRNPYINSAQSSAFLYKTKNLQLLVEFIRYL